MARRGWLETVRVHLPTAHMRAGGHELAVEGDTDAALGWVVGEGGVAGDQAVSQQAEGPAVGALHDPGRCGRVKRHAEGRRTRQVVTAEAEPAGVTLAALTGVEFGDQLRPTPAAPQRQEPGQPHADRIEGRRAIRAGEALAQNGAPGAAVEEAQQEVEVVQPLPGRRRLAQRRLRGQPEVVGAAVAWPPDRRCGGLVLACRRLGGRHNQAQWQQGADRFPVERLDEVGQEQAARRRRDVPRVAQQGPREAEQLVKGTVRQVGFREHLRRGRGRHPEAGHVSLPGAGGATRPDSRRRPAGRRRGRSGHTAAAADRRGPVAAATPGRHCGFGAPVRG